LHDTPPIRQLTKRVPEKNGEAVTGKRIEDKAVIMWGGAEQTASGTGTAGLALQGVSFAEQIGQRALDQYLLNRLPVAYFSQGLSINQPPETQIVEKDDFLFFLHGRRSYSW
jgi:hypothetical protein